MWSKALVDGMPPAPAPATGLAAAMTLVAPNGSGGAVITSASSPPVRSASAVALPWSLTRSVSVVAHMVHCPGGASNKQTVRMANYRSGKGGWALMAGCVALGRCSCARIRRILSLCGHCVPYPTIAAYHLQQVQLDSSARGQSRRRRCLLCIHGCPPGRWCG